MRLSEIPVSLQKFGSVTVSFELKTPVCGDCSVFTLLHCLMLPNLSCHLPPLNYLPSYILEAAGFPAVSAEMDPVWIPIPEAMERKWIAVKGSPMKVA